MLTEGMATEACTDAVQALKHAPELHATFVAVRAGPGKRLTPDDPPGPGQESRGGRQLERALGARKCMACNQYEHPSLPE